MVDSVSDTNLQRFTHASTIGERWDAAHPPAYMRDWLMQKGVNL